MKLVEAGEVATEAVRHLTPDMLARLCTALDGASPVAVRHLIDSAMHTAARAPLRALIAAVPQGQVAALLSGAAAAHRHHITTTDRIEIVWTGPPTVAVPARPTQTVVNDLIATADEHLTLATYSAGDVSDIVAALNAKRKANPKLDIRLLLEIPRANGTGPNPLKDFGPLANIVNTLVWPRSARQHRDHSSMHIKVLLRDRAAALITSANISAAARTHNMELGLLVSGPDLPARLRSHFDELQERGLLVSPPAGA